MVSGSPALPGLTITLWNEEGRVLYRQPDNDKWFGRLDPNAPIVQAVRTRRAGEAVEAIGLEGVARVYALAHSREHPDRSLVVSVGVTRDELTAGANRELAVALTVLVGIFGFVLFAVISIATRFVRAPAAALVRASGRLAEGDLSARAPDLKSGGDMAALTVEFNRMAKRLEETLTSREQLEREVAERRRVENELRQLNQTLEQRVRERAMELYESEERFRSISAAAQDAIVLFDEQGRVTYWNAAAERLFRYGSDEVLGRDGHRLFAPERYHADADAGFARFRTTGTGPIVGTTRELTARRKDGTEFPVELSVSGLQLQGAWHAVGLLRDVTERKEAERHRGRLSAILEASPDFVATADPNGNVLYLNSAARRLLELPEGVDPSQVRINDTHPRWAADLVLKDGIPSAVRDGVWTGETAFLTPSGREIPVIQVILAHKRPDGTLEFLSTIARDISERKNYELRISRLNRTLSVLSGINSAIVRVRDRQKLFEEACRIAVEHGNFGMAWISEFDPVTLDVTPIAYGGSDTGEFVTSKTTARADVPLGQGVVGRAIRAKDLAFVNDLAAEPDVGSAKRREAIRRGYRSTIVLPLLLENAVFGTFTLYAKEPGFFDEEELKLLRELSRDISFALEFIQQQQKVVRLSRIQAVLSSINSAIVRIRDRQELFSEACRIAVEDGKFGMAWIGLLDPAAEEVIPVASAGLETSEFLAGVNSNIRENLPTGRSVLARAIKTRRPAFDNDITIEPQVGGARRQEAIRRGYRSVIALPLTVEGSVVGTLSLFAKETGFFTEEEIMLLTELAGDISFALEHMAGQEKIEKLSRIRAVSSGINAAIVRIRDREELFQEACRIVVEHGKFVMAWIGMLDEATQAIRPVARAGREEGYLEGINLSIDPSITKNLALAAEAVARHTPVVCNDIEADGRMRPWRAAALERGYQSVALLPLLLEQRAVGVFALYAPEPGFFDEEEVKLLIEMSGDVSFALDHIAKEARLNYLAYYNELTGLPNRVLFADRTNQRMRARGSEQRMVALILLDIERLRNINETLGHRAGDDLLRQVAARLKGAIEETDVLAHIGGDHFAIATRRAERGENVAHIIEQTLKVLSHPFEVNGNQLRVAARSGVAVYPTDGADAESLLKNAEAALNDAKKKGHRYLFYAPQMNARVAEQLKLENELRDAVARERFVLYYQPRFDIATKRIVGLEALIRWMHPERGMVSPAEFIPVLEETGMILEVGRWALTRAALDHAAWCAAGLKPPRIAVNVSQVQLRRRDFVDHVREALAAVDQAADRIDIEITESMLMEDIGGSIEKLKAVQSLGLNVAVDDFGTGYSSLSYLARLPINSLKIDRSFITQMPKGPEQMAIVSTVISLARALNLKVCAEGVETEEQANLLRLLRCDEAQGYLFARPMPPEEVERLLPRA